MSQYYEMGDVTLWNPAQRVSKVFEAHVAMFEGLVGVPSGITPMVSDEAQVEPGQFEEFVAALLAWRSQTGHPVVRALADGFVATVLVLAERAGVGVAWPGSGAGSGAAGGGGALEGRVAIQVGPGGVLDGGGGGWQGEVVGMARELARYMVR